MLLISEMQRKNQFKKLIFPFICNEDITLIRKGVNLLKLIEGDYLDSWLPRERVLILEEIIMTNFDYFDGRLLPVQHYIADGIYVRQLCIPAGHVITGSTHKKQNIASVVTGDVTIYDGYESKRIKAPYTFISKPGTKRIFYAFTNTLFSTTHRMNNPEETDVEKLKWEFMTNDRLLI